MPTAAENNKRIARNTLVLYVRMFITLAVTLYTSRVVLAALGVEDFGIYNVVGGVVSMFAIVTASMSSAISRFITFELGKGDEPRLRSVFQTAVGIQIAFAVIVLVLAEVVGVWFLNTHMNIPPERMGAANLVLQCALLAFMMNVLHVPFHAAVIAHERMNVFAYISILDVVMKLGVALALGLVGGDRLKVYAPLLFVVAVVVCILYATYAVSVFKECTLRPRFDRRITREMAGFASWTFIGTSATILRDQGGNVVLNLFGGPVVNAARGISLQVGHAVQSFSENFMTALRPQIIKSYASGDRDYMMTLVVQGARLSFYLLLLIALPVMINADYLLHLWLKEVPPHTIAFVILAVVFTLSESVSTPLITAMLATGKIRDYQLVVGGLQLMNLPIAYGLLRLGLQPESLLWTAICISQCCLAARLIMLRRLVGLSIPGFLRRVYLNVIVVTALSAAVVLLCGFGSDVAFGGFVVSTLAAVVVTALMEMFIGCNRRERAMVWKKVKQMTRRQ